MLIDVSLKIMSTLLYKCAELRHRYVHFVASIPLQVCIILSSSALFCICKPRPWYHWRKLQNVSSAAVSAYGGLTVQHYICRAPFASSDCCSPAQHGYRFSWVCQGPRQEQQAEGSCSSGVSSSPYWSAREEAELYQQRNGRRMPHRVHL